MTGSTARRRLALLGLATALAVAVGVGPGAGAALAFGKRGYSYDCGSSRGATLIATIYDSQPGHWVALSDRTQEYVEGEITPNRENRIGLPGGTGNVDVVILGSDPGYFDETTRVVCDAAP